MFGGGEKPEKKEKPSKMKGEATIKKITSYFTKDDSQIKSKDEVSTPRT